jgi:NADPH-dependent 2,4-dienoyl-CoA reductase/sulfur reductase-like enzyme
LSGYPVEIRDEEIIVSLPEKAATRRTPEMSKRDEADDRSFVILGGGAAGYMAAQTLREDGFTGRITMITREDRLPYDRPNLSKDYLQGTAKPEWMPLREEDFFTEHDIEVPRETEVTAVDTAAKTLTLAGGKTLTFDSLLIATGGIPRELPFATSAKNVFLLRSFADADAIIAAAGNEKRVVVIGGSFIGMEVAASLRTRGCDVTVVVSGEVPFQKLLGPEIGNLFKAIHEQNGVKFRLATQVTELVENGAAQVVVLDGGERIEADCVVAGVGVKPATDFLEGIPLHPDGGVIADKFLSIAPEVYAAGDIAHFPDPRSGALTRIEHWRTALQQGRVAAHNMAGRTTEFAAVPFFWTTQFGATLNFVGHVTEWDRIEFQGEVEKQDFLALYFKDGQVAAVAGMNRDHELAEWEEKFRLDRVPAAEDLG